MYDNNKKIDPNTRVLYSLRSGDTHGSFECVEINYSAADKLFNLANEYNKQPGLIGASNYAKQQKALLADGKASAPVTIKLEPGVSSFGGAPQFIVTKDGVAPLTTKGDTSGVVAGIEKFIKSKK